MIGSFNQESLTHFIDKSL